MHANFNALMDAYFFWLPRQLCLGLKSTRSLQIHAFAAVMSFVMGLVWSQKAQARWRTPDEADAHKIKYESHVYIKKDGTSVEREQVAWKLLNRTGVKDFGTFSFTYDSATTQVKVVRASITTNGKKRTVGKESIEDKAKASDSSGFDSINNITISFPGAEIGSIIEYETEETTFRSKLNGYRALRYSFGFYPSSAGQMVTIESEVPLKYEAAGPPGYLKVTTGRKGANYTIKSLLTKEAFFDSTTDAGKFDFYSPDFPVPTFQTTTEQSWSTLLSKMLPTYEALLNEELPSEFNSLLEAAKKEKGFVAQANSLHAGISQSLRYMGDWRDAENSYFPRKLKEISNTKTGDCKDLSLVLAVMLRKLGYRAELAAVEQKQNKWLPTKLPMLRYFDHMIVRVEVSPGDVHWLDPTRELAFSNGIWPAIEGRRALVMIEASTTLEQIPRSKAEDNFLEIKLDLLDSTETESTYRSSVSSSLQYGGALLRSLKNKSEKERIDYIERMLTAGKRIIQRELDKFDVSSNSVQTTSFSGKFRIEELKAKTTLGIARSVPGSFDEILKIRPKEMDLGIDFGTPETVILNVTMPAKGLIGDLPENCVVESPWVSAKQHFVLENERIKITTITSIKAAFMSLAQLRSKEFEEVQSKIRNCFWPRLMIFKP